MFKQSLIIAVFATLSSSYSFSATHIDACASQQQLISLAEETIKTVPPVAGLSIAIANPACGQFTYTHGYANHASKTRMTDDMQLPIASNTKPVLLALALMLLEEHKTQFPHGLKSKITDITDQQGKLIFTADGKINLPDGGQLDLTDSELYRMQTGQSFDCKHDTTYQCPRLDRIDLHHLLMESSGLHDFYRGQDLTRTGIPDIAKFILSKIFSPKQDPGSQTVMNDVQIIKTMGLYKMTDPDPIKPRQSHNIDAFLLSIILERVSGEPLNQLLHDHILKPLRLPPDSMKFVTEPARQNELIARRYAYLNTDEEVAYALKHHTMFPIVTPQLAYMLSPAGLQTIHREVTFIPYNNTHRPALDLLNLDGQGFTPGLGAGGMIAQPKAYIQFYRALANGTLLSPASQQLFKDSFLAQPDENDFKVSVGYASHVRLTQTLPNGYQLSLLTHAGFVLGGESWAIYDEHTDTVIMLATNFSGYSDNEVASEMPAFFVTKTPYLNAHSLMALGRKYLELYSPM